MNWNQLATDVHADNQHWWHDPATGVPLYRNRGEMFMLMVSEIAEAMEGERKDLMDDHLPHRKMAEVELADAVIRIMDYCGHQQYDVDAQIQRVGKMKDTPPNKGEALLLITREIIEADRENLYRAYYLCRTLYLIEQYAHTHGYDLAGAIEDKRAYNKVRADHKPEARLAANGKKW
jgi:hypothetical protein